MEMMLAVANENRNPVSVDKLPKGANITHFTVYKTGTMNVIGRGPCTTAKQAVKRLDRIVMTGMKVDLELFADDGDRGLLLRETYVMKNTGAVKV